MLTQRALEHSASEALALADEYHAAQRMKLNTKPSYVGPYKMAEKVEQPDEIEQIRNQVEAQSPEPPPAGTKGQRPRGLYRNEILIRLANETGDR